MGLDVLRAHRCDISLSENRMRFHAAGEAKEVRVCMYVCVHVSLCVGVCVWTEGRKWCKEEEVLAVLPQ